jgi:integrase
LEAASRARKAYLLLKSQGWDAMWEVYRVRKSSAEAERQNAKYHGTPIAEEHKKKEGEIETVGEFVEKVKQVCFVRARTLRDYIRDFYQILSEIYGIDYGNEKYNYFAGKNLERMAKIGLIKMREITPEKIETWKNNSLKMRVQEKASKYNSAVTTINSILRGAKNLFSRKNLKAIGPASGIVNPFAEIEFFKESSKRYATEFDARALIEDAQKTLKTINRNAYIALPLGVGAGLRKNEIDKLEWGKIDLDYGILSIIETHCFDPKSDRSSSEIKLSQFMVEELKWHRVLSEGDFVLSSKIEPIVDATWGHYRCEKDYEILYNWLRERGISARKPLHTLRKEYGAQICREHGLYMASRALRHSSYSVTERHYTDRTALVVPNFF